MKKRKILEGRGSEKKKKKQKDGKKEKEKNGKKKERKKTTKRVRSADWRAAVPFLAHARQITTPLSNVLMKGMTSISMVLRRTGRIESRIQIN